MLLSPFLIKPNISIFINSEDKLYTATFDNNTLSIDSEVKIDGTTSLNSSCLIQIGNNNYICNYKTDGYYLYSLYFDKEEVVVRTEETPYNETFLELLKDISTKLTNLNTTFTHQ